MPGTWPSFRSEGLGWLGLRVLDLGSSGFRDFGLRLLGLFELFVGLYHKSDRSGNLYIYIFVCESLTLS